MIRLIDPSTFRGAGRDVPVAARVITVVLALAVLAATFVVLRRPSVKPAGRALEAAAIVAAGPLIASYSWGTHLVLLLLPMLVLVAWGVRRRDWLGLRLGAAGWLRIGPAHNWVQTLLASGYSHLTQHPVIGEV